MKRSSLIFFITYFLAFFSDAKNDKPNIIVLLCDDLGYGDLSSYGHPFIETPNLDDMAAEGIRLTSCYSAAPVCSPSRVGLLTGRSPNKAGVYDWIPHVKPEERGEHMQAHEITIPQLLKKAGYQTCLSGKWHCNGAFNSPDQQPQPDHFRFDHWFATQNNAQPTHKNPMNYVRNGEEVGPLEGFSCQLVVDEAIEFIQNRDKERPFFLFATFHEPHEPIESPVALVQKHLKHTANENQAQYFANVENMDLAVGRLMSFLEQSELKENTLVIFTSDNGPETHNRYPGTKRTYGTPGPLKGMKLWTNEGGIRVPGIIYWPAKIRDGFTSDSTISSLDFLPTFCEIAGVELPERELDGTSITDVFKGQDIKRKKPLIWAFYNATNERRVALIHGSWKIIAKLSSEDGATLRRYKSVRIANTDQVKAATLSDYKLYHLKTDISENIDLSKDNPNKLEEMKALIQAEYQTLVKDSIVWDF